MELPLIHIYTHDSIGVGEDGPTHQPIEHLASIRAMPGVIDLRPGDANEVVEAWRVIMPIRHEPVALMLSRQPLPTLDRSRYAPRPGSPAAPTCWPTRPEGDPEVILIATGSEVAMTVEAYEQLTADGIARGWCRCRRWSCSTSSPAPTATRCCRRRSPPGWSVEKGTPFGWDRWVGPTGAIIGMSTFGASAPMKVLQAKFGFGTSGSPPTVELAQADPPGALGRDGPSRRSRCRSATSSARAGASSPSCPRCRSRSTRTAGSTATGRCRSEGARLSLENTADSSGGVYFQVDYQSGDVPDDGLSARPVAPEQPGWPADVHTILDGVTGRGHYVGTYLAWGVNNSGWWGEGEMKFYLDGDDEFPTICGTGTEDYFGGAWNFDVPGQGYTAYSTPYLGLHQVIRPDGLYVSQQRFGMYRWHITDPIPSPPGCGSTSRRSAGVAAAATGRSTTTSPPRRTSTSTPRGPPPPRPPPRAGRGGGGAPPPWAPPPAGGAAAASGGFHLGGGVGCPGGVGVWGSGGWGVGGGSSRLAACIRTGGRPRAIWARSSTTMSPMLANASGIRRPGGPTAPGRPVRGHGDRGDRLSRPDVDRGQHLTRGYPAQQGVVVHHRGAADQDQPRARSQVGQLDRTEQVLALGVTVARTKTNSLVPSSSTSGVAVAPYSAITRSGSHGS